MLRQLLAQLKNDCLTHGYGRKKWWADQLGVPPLTLSHWLAGRQSPSGTHALAIKDILDQQEQSQRAVVWSDHLWDSYYTGAQISSRILPYAILEVLSAPSTDSRTLALLSRTIEKDKPKFETPRSPWLKNRLGWLLTVSNQKPPFSAETSIKTQSLLQVALKSPGLSKQLRRYQTPIGKKWRIYDCPLDDLKESLH